VLHTPLARRRLDIGFVPAAGGLSATQMPSRRLDVLFNLGADEIEIAPGAFHGLYRTHGDAGRTAPTSSFRVRLHEKSGIFVNTRPSADGGRAGFPRRCARDWAFCARSPTCSPEASI